MTKRLHDWQLRMEACLAERWAKPFAWGELDCTLFAADVVQAITGVDLAADFRGTYSTLEGAMRILARAGGLAAIASARLGQEIPPSMAQPGDVGLIESADIHALCIWGGSAWISMAVDGLQPVRGVSKAWRCC